MPEKPSEEEVARVRAQGRQILTSLKSDPAFAEEVRRDPTAALVSRGIPEAAALEWQKKPGGDVQAYQDCYYSATGTCDNTSCFESVYY